MLQITPQMRILVCVEAVDFRNGIDGLAQLQQQPARSRRSEEPSFCDQR